eukprot:jgi/Bigna1/70280/fgenesh1_pg.11_\
MWNDRNFMGASLESIEGFVAILSSRRKETLCVYLDILLLGEYRGYISTSQHAKLFDSASDVWFERMSERELKAHWSFDDETLILDKIRWLSNQTVVAPIQIRLVGFRGDGYRNIRISKQELQKYINALRLPSTIVSTEDEIHEGYHSPKMEIQVQHSIRITHAPGSLANIVSREIAKSLLESTDRKQAGGESEREMNLAEEEGGQVRAGGGGDHATGGKEVNNYDILARFESVDNVIRDDYRHSGRSKYIIYLLNPSIPPSRKKSSAMEARPPPTRYGYTSPPGGRCGSEIGMGREEKDRYVWVDLNAVPARRTPLLPGTTGPWAWEKQMNLPHSFTS